MSVWAIIKLNSAEAVDESKPNEIRFCGPDCIGHVYVELGNDNRQL